MNHSLKDVLKEILRMPQEQRAFLADKLIDSLEAKKEMDVEIAWQKEIQKRIDEAENDQVVFMSWEDVKQKLREQ